MKQFRLVKVIARRGVSEFFRIERRRWWLPFIWYDLKLQDFDDLKEAQQAFMLVIANQGTKVVLNEA